MGSVFSRLADIALEATVVPSFTKIGCAVRRRTDDWAPLDSYDLTGRNVLLTGGTSGLGKAATRQLLECGATVAIVGRDADRNAEAAAELGHTDRLHTFQADVGDLDDVRRLAGEAAALFPKLDVLVHNAGALTDERHETTDGIEATVASQVVGPFLLTALLLDELRAAAPARVLTMSSGGMYTVALEAERIEMPPGDYQGAKQYALAKRAQVTLNEMWPERLPDADIHFHAVHPGWADTPGVQASLPGFAKVVGPLLRSDDDGADTIVWLTADPIAITTNGGFWHDRRRRSLHRLPTTARSDTEQRRAELWAWVAERAGVDPTS